MADAEVLIVDDCRMTTLLLRHVLLKEGLDADTAATGLEGLDRALHGDYRLLLLDIVLPGIDGVNIARKIREVRPHDGPEIYLLTGLGEQFRSEMVDEAQASGVFFKPVSPSKIVEAARGLLISS
ncbi:MAG: response regulator [Planctomycetota bacterium]